MLNFTNPMTICTRTLTRVAPALKVFGCWHEVFSSQRMLARVASQYLEVSPAPARAEIHVYVVGSNHFTWIDRAEFRGVDLLPLLRQHLAAPDVLREYTREEVEAQNNNFFSAAQVKFALFQRFGILAAAGDRHLVEFVPGFTRSPEDLFRWGLSARRSHIGCSAGRRRPNRPRRFWKAKHRSSSMPAARRAPLCSGRCWGWAT